MKRRIALLLAFMIAVLSFAGCGKETNPLVGKWAYIHDDSTVVLELKNNGKALYEGNQYSYTLDDSFITLKGSDGSEEKFRYLVEKNGFYFYKNTTYVSKTADVDSLVGLWNGKEVEKWSFEFTANGEFKEDGYFPGQYELDTTNKTIKLIYNDHFEDTTVYYEINNGELTLQYPWMMVTAK